MPTITRRHNISFASFADDIYLNPIGQVGIQGLRQENLYFKSMIENLKLHRIFSV